MQYLFFLLIIVLCPKVTLADHASASFETGSAGAIMTISGATLPKGKFVIGPNVQFIENDEISDEELEALGALEEEVHSTESVLQVSANIAYGLTDNLTLGLSLPYVERSNVRAAHHDAGMGEVEVAGDSKGLGDMSVFTQYRFYHDDASDAAVIAGIKTPTGDNKERENDGALFETEQQPGSGSWDPFIGMGLNRSWGSFGISSNVLYTFVTEGQQQTNLGNIFNYNLAGSYRIFSPEGGHGHHKHTHGLGIVDYVDFILEFNGDHRKRVEINKINDENTGGHTLYLSPGIRVGLGHSWSVYASGGLPIVNDLNGQQSEPDYRIIGGISKTF